MAVLSGSLTPPVLTGCPVDLGRMEHFTAKVDHFEEGGFVCLHRVGPDAPEPSRVLCRPDAFGSNITPVVGTCYSMEAPPEDDTRATGVVPNPHR